jgi:hypothetical protein
MDLEPKVDLSGMGGIATGNILGSKFIKLIKKSLLIGSRWCQPGDIVPIWQPGQNERVGLMPVECRVHFTRAQQLVDQKLAVAHKLVPGEAPVSTESVCPVTVTETEDEDGKKKKWIEIAATGSRGQKAVAARQKAAV